MSQVMDVKFAFVFPGQGSQKVGMLASLLDETIVRETFEQASDVLDQDMLALTQQDPNAYLGRTEWTQPALLCASVALWRLWQSRTQRLPAAVAGHSLGEYSALVCAQSLDFEDALKLVHQRGLLMSEAVPQGVGAMAAVLGLEDHTVVELCQNAAQDQVVQAVNFNSPGQVVIAGHTEAVQRACESLREAGARKVVVLPVSVPSHCALMEPAAEKLSHVLSSISITTPQIPLYHNVNAALETCPDRLKTHLVRQLFQPVLWVDTIRAMVKDGIRMIGECGAGAVLTGLDKRIERQLKHFSMDTSESFAQVLEHLQSTESDK